MMIRFLVLLLIGLMTGFTEAGLVKLEPLNLQNNQFMIAFPANPSTGYSWSIVSYDKTKLFLVSSQYMTPDKTRRIGAAGKMIYVFEVYDTPHYPMATRIQFRYARPWEIKGGIEKSAVVTMTQARQKPSVKIQ